MSTVPNGNNQMAEHAAAKAEDASKATPITNTTVAPEHKKKKLVRKQAGSNQLKYKAWQFGHIFTIVFGVITFTFQIFLLPNKWYINSICYRLSLLGSMVALTATFSHKFGIKFLPPFPTLIAQQNFQYLILAIIWCFTFKSIFKIIPYFLISTLQLSAHKNIEAVTKHLAQLASFIAYDELFLIVYLLLRTLLFRNTSGYQLTAFLFFYWLRILYNKETGNLFRSVVTRLDGKVTTSTKNEKVLHYWSKIKKFLDAKQYDKV
ncbi:uncharacterized protein AC631_05154 [Debaryomyces fabryi]|uniref:Nucleoporin POM33 n=1 Tax=Debaryomyces fabryi TaxID=58627 RepID=A0A0V1PS71_9ASCO|nr:uncharacterized protein AC631_05154 [Debaryomyces fabryi]KRZ99078.1 hypothetical protein AC631_05154 [Debaryomyces fabryi]CUM45221.1 unnamed protein product [Debaryomyces fabryi]